MSFFKGASAVAVSLAFLSLTMLSGCTHQPPPEQPSGPVKTVNPDANREKVELMPPGSGEQFRRHVYDSNGVEIAIDIQYTNGDKAETRVRPDGTTESYRLRDRDGKVKCERQFAADGKTVVKGFERREDGTTLVQIETDKAGVTKTTTYWYDGKRVFSVQVRRPDGTFETSYYRKSGNVWAKRQGVSGSKLTLEEMYTSSGVIEFRREFVGNRVIISRYNYDGKLEYRQTFEERTAPWGGSQQIIVLLEEFDTSDGRLTRKVIVEGSGQGVNETFNYDPDGSVLHRTMRSDGAIDKEERLDATGHQISHKEYKADEDVRESVDRARLWPPYERDPAQSWKMQEDYPYYRNFDD